MPNIKFSHNIMKHYALIPAKEKSTRCKNKNWREFILGKSIVEYTLDKLPFFFDEIIVSTDKKVKFEKCIVHKRRKSLATKKSPINPTILEIIKKYKIKGNDYIWLLNPTSVFRNKIDFYKIKHLIETKFDSVISVNKIKPFIWVGNTPTFNKERYRENTQDFKKPIVTENGQFFVFKVSTFIKHNTWYSGKQCLFIQDTIESTIDIDSEEDFLFAQKYAELIETDIIENETLQIHNLIKPPVTRKLPLLFNHIKRYMDAINRLNIRKSDIVIDASCGLGYGTFILSMHCRAIGLDINENYLKKAKSLFHLDFNTYDKCHLKVDKIVCIETIEHIPKKDLIKFRGQLLKLLKKGGSLFLTFPLGKDKPSEYNKYHLNEPSLKTINRLFQPYFKAKACHMENKINSFNQKMCYCSILFLSHV